MSNQLEELSKACDQAAKAGVELLKSHVKQYTRADGTMVQEHDDSRTANAPKQFGESGHTREKDAPHNESWDNYESRIHNKAHSAYESIARSHASPSPYTVAKVREAASKKANHAASKADSSGTKAAIQASYHHNIVASRLHHSTSPESQQHRRRAAIDLGVLHEIYHGE